MLDTGSARVDVAAADGPPPDPATAGAPTASRPAHDPGALLAQWLGEPSGAATGLRPRLLRLSDGHLVRLDVERWARPVDAADRTLLRRTVGPVIDVGCGPGRLTAALHTEGVDVLGLDVLADVPRLARRAGAPVQVGDVFGPVPREGQWRTVVLADGNIGIGGDPVRLLRRARSLLAPGGTVLCELHDRGGLRAGPVRLEGLGCASAWFPWALVGVDAAVGVAARAGLVVTERWTAGGRAFVALRRARSGPSRSIRRAAPS